MDNEDSSLSQGSSNNDECDSDIKIVKLYKSYRSVDKFSVRNKERSIRTYVCNQCAFNTPQVKLFHIHMTKKHALDEGKKLTTDKRFKVNRPPTPPRKKDNINGSRREYYRERNDMFKERYAQYIQQDGTAVCPVCEWKTTRGSGMFHRHVTTVHAWTESEMPARWKCGECEFETDVHRKFREHLKRHERPYACNQCDRRFITKQNLSDHLLLHTGEQPLKCDYEGCSYSTIQKRCLEEHNRKHTGERLSCPYCEFTTVYSTALRTHVNMKHEAKNRFRCDEPDCCYVTNDKPSFQRHFKIHLNMKNFECCHCKYRSVSKHQVVQHIQRVHQQEKAYACDKCPFTTGYPLSIRLHLMTHLGLKPFGCALCDYSSTQRVKILNHLASKHPDANSSAADPGIHVVDKGVKFQPDLSQYRVFHVYRDGENPAGIPAEADPGPCFLEGNLDESNSLDGLEESCVPRIENNAVSTFESKCGVIKEYGGLIELQSKDGKLFIGPMETLMGFKSSDMVSTGEDAEAKLAIGLTSEHTPGVITEEDINSTNQLTEHNIFQKQIKSESGVDDVDENISIACVVNSSQLQNSFDGSVVTDLGEQLSVYVVKENENTEKVACEHQNVDLSNVSTSSGTVYSCSLCGYGSSDYESISNHLALHQGLRLFQCPHCGFSNQELSTVENHLAVEHAGTNDDKMDMQINEISMRLDENDSCQDPCTSGS